MNGGTGLLAAVAAFVAVVLAIGDAIAGEFPLTPKIAGKHKILGTDDWYGGRRTVFDFEGYEAWVVEPPAGVRPAEGNPWTWTMQWATAFVERTSVPRLVKERGWRHATVITFKDKMDEHGLEVSAQFQKYLVGELGFAKKANLIGMSWGGFFSTRYAVTYPENVARVYLDAPLLCFWDFDPAKETCRGGYGPWVQMAPADGKWSNDPRMPVNMAENLAKTGIPIFLVYGGQDKSCPPEINAIPFIERFKAAGGEKNLKVLYREYFGHHPHGVELNDNAIIDFLTRPSDPKTAAEKERDEAIARLKALPTVGEITGISLTNDAVRCDFTLRTGENAAVHCLLLLPPPSAWDGRFWGIGNEGYGDKLKWWLVRDWQMPRGVRRVHPRSMEFRNNEKETKMNRREFIVAAAAAAGTARMGVAFGGARTFREITIAKTSCQFEREPMVRPFGFKGGYLTEEWIVSAYVASTSGKHGIGLGTQSSLWSDAKVFAENSECGGNAIMFSMTQYALKLLEGRSFMSPVELNDWLWPQVWEYGKTVAANPALRATYALNALVAVDNAVWVLFAKENGFTSFDEMIPDAYRPALSCHHAKCASIPLFSYKVPVGEIKEAVDSGYFFMKIKIGQPGTQEEMLAKDMARVSEIHAVLKDCRTPYTKSGKLPYYFDANGRYEKKETFLKFVDYLKKIGAYDQVAIVEEPFDEYADIDVNDIPLRLAADESAHTVKDALERIEMGYRAMALKPIAKTMSMSMKIAQAAYEKNVPCFCADLTVCPAMVEWNKSVAARLPAFPGIGDLGLVETNGHMNFRNWETMRKDLAYPSAHWTRTEKGVFECDADYYAKSGGILEPMPRYEKMYEKV